MRVSGLINTWALASLAGSPHASMPAADTRARHDEIAYSDIGPIVTESAV